MKVDSIDFKIGPILRVQYTHLDEALHVFFKKKDNKVQERIYIGNSKSTNHTTKLAFYGMFYKKTPSEALSYYSNHIKEQYKVSEVKENVKFIK